MYNLICELLICLLNFFFFSFFLLLIYKRVCVYVLVYFLNFPWIKEYQSERKVEYSKGIHMKNI